MTTQQHPETLKLGPQKRTLTLRAEGAGVVDAEARTLRFPFSSEEPCDMWYGTEILSHAPGAMRQGSRQATMPLLFNHNRDDLLGVVESIQLGVDQRGYCTARFGKDDRGDWAMQQAADGVLVNASFMYRVFKFEEDVEEEIYTATDWEPYEISLVTVPADPTVGVGRAAGGEEQDVPVIRARSATPPAPAETQPGKETEMKLKHIKQDAAGDGTSGAASGAATVDVKAERASAAQGERERIAGIEAMCRSHKIGDELARGLIQRGATLDEARGAVLDAVLQRGAAAAADLGQSASPDLSEKEKARYSMIRALNAAISNNWKEAGFELEVSNDIAKRSGKSSQGFFVPTNIDYAMRAAYSTGAPSTGGVTVATNLLAGSFIELLRNKARVLQMGATVLSGLVGNVDIPRQSGAATAYWVAEGANLTESEMTFDKVSLTQKSVGTYGMISRNMLMQSTPDIEMLVRADLLAIIALGIDLAALSGTGTNGQPLGIANTTNIGSVVGGTNGANITIDNLIDLETVVTSQNVDETNLAYLSNAKVVGSLKKLKSTTGAYLWTNLPGGNRGGTPGEINGYNFARTNQARSTLVKGSSGAVCSEVFFGDWTQVLLGEWGVLEILPNPYDSTAYKQGGVLIRAMQSVDVAIRHPQAFSVMSDALTP